MPLKILALIMVMTQLSACVASPRIEIPERFTFDYVPASVQPMSYADMLCCEQCSA